jgi:hypothetical protein
MGKTLKDIVSNIKCHVGTDDEEILTKYASQVLPDEIMVDFGTCTGRSAGILAVTNPKAKVCTFDVDLSSCQIPSVLLQTSDRLYSSIKSWTYEENNVAPVTIYHESSLSMPWNKEIALINIDANHKYEAVKADIEKWAPFVKLNGIMIFHDYWTHDEPGVAKAVDELVITGKFKVIDDGGLSRVLRRII